MKTKLSRWLALAVLSGLCASAAAQLTDTTPRSDAQRLACLERPKEAPEYPERSKYDDAYGFMRVKLTFSKPDEAPEVEVLVNTARQDMQDRAYRYLKRMRLPCLTPDDGPVQAVQEFDFRNSPLEPFPMEPVRNKAEVCIVTPRKDMGDVEAPRKPEHVVVAMVFDGDGTQPPQTRILYSTANRRLERAVLERVAQYRMPCRKAGDKMVMFRQQFHIASSSQDHYVFKNKLFNLVQFLGMTEGIRQLKADFDLDTMGCPFKVNYTIYGPALPNEARVAGGKPDPNKLAFIRWIEARPMNFKDADMANDLFGETLQIDVPCGHLKLDPDAAAAAATAPASAGG